MKKHHNTLFVTTQGAYLAVEGETVVVRHEGMDKAQFPLHMLEGLVCFGQVSCSPFLLGRCAARGIGIAFLSERGRFLARVQGPVSGNVLLRRTQYRMADDPQGAARVARGVVLAKLANSRTVLMRAARDHSATPGAKRLRSAAAALAGAIDRLDGAPVLDTIRGVEGDAARVYFDVFDDLIVAQKEGFTFSGRTRRPPRDNVNALLSFVYTLLTHDVVSALEGVGLDPQVGFLHRDRPGRPGLALDLVEEFRAFMADRLVLSLINRRQIAPSRFVKGETGGVWMDDDTRKKVLIAYQERKQEEIRHPFLDETTTVGMLWHLQAWLLARYLRGDLDAYPPFVWR